MVSGALAEETGSTGATPAASSSRGPASLGKQSRGSSRLVDLAVAMVGARLGRRLVLNSGKGETKRRTGVVW